MREHDKESQLYLLEATLKKKNELIAELSEKLERAERDYRELLRSNKSMRKRLASWKGE